MSEIPFEVWKLGDMSLEIQKLREENEQLKEALKKCSPMTSVVESQTVKGFTVKCCYDCETTQEDNHEENCEYIKLIGGEGE